MAKEGYPELIDYVATRTGISKHRTWRVLKEYSKVLKESVKKGNSIEIDKLITITFTTKEGYIFENKVIDLEDQVEIVSDNLEMSEIDVRNLILTYIRRIHDRVQEGYQVNIKGVSYVIPSKDRDGEIICTPRVSPVMEKPDVADFVLSTNQGNIILKELLGEELRFKIEVSEDLEIPYKIATKDQKRKFELKEINI